jgi:hypothetical protein
MKRCTVIATLLCAGVMLSGCERNEASEASPAAYDPDVDAPVSILDRAVNPDVAGNQSAISRRAGAAPPPARATPTATGAPTPTAAAGDGIAGVKQKIADISAAIKRGEEEREAELFIDQDAEVIRALLLDSKNIEAKVKSFEELVRNRLGMELPADLKSGLSPKLAGGASGFGFADLDVNKVKFDQTGETVVVDNMKGQRLTFSLVGSEYKASLPPGMKKLQEMARELLAAQGVCIDRISAGINRGSITEDNIEPMAKRISDQTVMPVIKKIMGMTITPASPGGPGTADEAPADANQPKKTENRRGVGGMFQNITDPLGRGSQD